MGCGTLLICGEIYEYDIRQDLLFDLSNIAAKVDRKDSGNTVT